MSRTHSPAFKEKYHGSFQTVHSEWLKMNHMADRCCMNWKKGKGDWGSLIHDSNEMSQAVESQEQRIPIGWLYYSFHHKYDGSKGEKEHKGLTLLMGKLALSTHRRDCIRAAVIHSKWTTANQFKSEYAGKTVTLVIHAKSVSKDLGFF